MNIIKRLPIPGTGVWSVRVDERHSIRAERSHARTGFGWYYYILRDGREVDHSACTRVICKRLIALGALLEGYAPWSRLVSEGRFTFYDSTAKRRPEIECVVG